MFIWRLSNEVDFLNLQKTKKILKRRKKITQAMLIQRSVETINTTKLLTFNRQREKPPNEVRRQQERGMPSEVLKSHFTSSPFSRPLRCCILKSLFGRWDTYLENGVCVFFSVCEKV